MFEVPVLAEQELVEQEVLRVVVFEVPVLAEQEVLLPECVGRLVWFGRRHFAVPLVLWPPLGDV